MLRNSSAGHCVQMPTNNTASHDNHEKIDSWVSFSFPYEYGTLFGIPGAPLPVVQNFI